MSAFKIPPILYEQFEKLLKAGTKRRDLTLFADVIQEDEFNDVSTGINESGGADGNCTVEDLKTRSERAGGMLRHIVDESKFKKFQDSQDHMLRKFQGKIGENVEMIQPRDVALPSSVFCIRPILEDGLHTGSDFVLDFLSPYVESRVVGALAEEQSKQSESMSGLEAERRFHSLLGELATTTKAFMTLTFRCPNPFSGSTTRCVEVESNATHSGSSVHPSSRTFSFLQSTLPLRTSRRYKHFSGME
mmetsp:Transcript_11660/g.23474  ORF Transcript_11660/g.23474 Transcript_11660/m.23474 type:complete len:247 (-) Transcript_11660:478-1218(-)